MSAVQSQASGVATTPRSIHATLSSQAAQATFTDRTLLCLAGLAAYISFGSQEAGLGPHFGAVLMGVLAGSFVAGFAGFAFSAVAGSILLHFTDAVVAVPLLLACSITTQLFTIVSLRHAVRWRDTAFLLLGGFAGIPAGAALLTTIEPRTFSIGFGAFLLVYAAYMLVRPSARLKANSRLTQVVIGMAGGVTGGAIAFPGAIPTIWCGLRQLGKDEQRGVVQPFILCMQIATLTYFSGVGLLDSSTIHLYLWSAPVVLGGTWLGLRCFRQIDDAAFRKLVLALLMFSAAALVW